MPVDRTSPRQQAPVGKVEQPAARERRQPRPLVDPIRELDHSELPSAQTERGSNQRRFTTAIPAQQHRDLTGLRPHGGCLQDLAVPKRDPQRVGREHDRISVRHLSAARQIRAADEQQDLTRERRDQGHCSDSNLGKTEIQEEHPLVHSTGVEQCEPDDGRHEED